MLLGLVISESEARNYDVLCMYNREEQEEIICRSTYDIRNKFRNEVYNWIPSKTRVKKAYEERDFRGLLHSPPCFDSSSPKIIVQDDLMPYAIKLMRLCPMFPIRYRLEQLGFTCTLFEHPNECSEAEIKDYYGDVSETDLEQIKYYDIAALSIYDERSDDFMRVWGNGQLWSFDTYDFPLDDPIQYEEFDTKGNLLVRTYNEIHRNDTLYDLTLDYRTDPPTATWAMQPDVEENADYIAYLMEDETMDVADESWLTFKALDEPELRLSEMNFVEGERHYPSYEPLKDV